MFVPIQRLFGNSFLAEAAAVVQKFGKLSSYGIRTDSGNSNYLVVFAIITSILQGVQVSSTDDVGVTYSITYENSIPSE